jgi:hypothetical protein
VLDVAQGSVVVPLVEVAADLRSARLLGTAFLINNPPIWVTAAHVLGELTDRLVFISVVADGRHVPLRVLRVDAHTTADVAVFEVDADPASLTASPLQLTSRKVIGGQSYLQWGYPVDAVYVAPGDGLRVPKLTPEPIFVRGYVRRRFDRELPIAEVRGSAFLELSELPGRGASGSPVIATPLADCWEVIGIYVAENGSLDRDRPSVGYAARPDSLVEWQPGLGGAPVVVD